MAIKQIDPLTEVEEYQQQLEELMRQARDGEIERDEFQRRVAEITAALLLLLFLLGSRLPASQVIASVQLNTILADNELQARFSANGLADEIYNGGKYAVGDDRTVAQSNESIASRAALWAGTALGLYAIGQTWRQDDPYLMWQVGPTEHCSDCARLNGQVHRASEWRASGWQPRIRRLECGGWRCQCGFVETGGPSRGGF